MLEQELASIIKFVLSAAGDPNPYYWNVPDGFSFPAVFFPTPEIESMGDTFRTYRLDYTWYVQFFHTSTQAAHDMALSVYEAIKRARNLVPLIDEHGEYLTEGIKGIRIGEPALKPTDNGAVQLMIRFASRRPYYVPDKTLMTRWIAVIEDKTERTATVMDGGEEDSEEVD